MNGWFNRQISIYRPIFLMAFMILMSCTAYALTHEAYRAEAFIFAFGLFAVFVCGFGLIRLLRLGDPYLFMIIFALIVVSLTMLFRLNFSIAIKQTLWFSGGMVGYFLIAAVYKHLKNPHALWVLCPIISVILFAVTLKYGKVVNGAKNWLYFMDGRFSVQPSEFIKLFYIFALAALFASKKKRTFKRRLVPLVLVYFHMGCLALQNEFGLAVLLFLLYIVIAYTGGKDKFFLFLNVAFVSVAGVLGYRFISHIQIRVAMWQNPFSDPSGKGYQILQSLFALASGGFMGVGYGGGSPEVIPEVSSDFIFAAICEEFGLMGGIALILLYFLLFYRALKIALMVTTGFHKLLAVGLGSCIALQAFIIIGGVTKMIPMTGITLPFVSYGGSSLVSCFMAMGILQGISARKEELADEIG